MKNNEPDKYANLAVVMLVPLVSLFIFLLFSAAASALIAALFYTNGSPEEHTLIPSFIAKAVTCFIFAFLLFIAVLRHRNAFITATGTPDPAPAPINWAPLLIVMAIAAAFVFPRLDAYPWAAPDEIHHLTVARNLALHATYASGHPDTGLREFDTYDSVGAPVIAPIALAFRIFGVHLYAARAVMAIYFLILCAALYILLAGTDSRSGSSERVSVPASGSSPLPQSEIRNPQSAILLMLFSFGSIYLARTLYGEVPGLAWMALGLLAWRRALRAPRALIWGLLAGLAFGLAILCKSILVLSAFAFLGALIYDRITFRRIRLPHILAPAAGVVLVIGAWWAIQTFSRHDIATAAGGTLGIYKHNLMLGLRSAPRALLGILVHPMQTLPLIFCMLVFSTGPFRKTYSPPLVVLHFIAIFYALWWVFFTPGTMPRYLWFSAAIAALYTSPAIYGAASLLRGIKTQYYMRPLVFGVLIPVAASAVMVPASRLVQELRAVYTVDEMRDDYAVAAWVAALPQETPVAATWPVSGTLGMFANRAVSVLENLPNPAPPNQAFIIDTMTWPHMLDGIQPAQRFGRYAVVMTKE